MKDLFYGRYFVKETKAPEGFVLDTGVYEVMIDTDGKPARWRTRRAWALSMKRCEET